IFSEGFAEFCSQFRSQISSALGTTRCGFRSNRAVRRQSWLVPCTPPPCPRPLGPAYTLPPYQWPVDTTVTLASESRGVWRVNRAENRDAGGATGPSAEDRAGRSVYLLELLLGAAPP